MGVPFLESFGSEQRVHEVGDEEKRKHESDGVVECHGVGFHYSRSQASE